MNEEAILEMDSLAPVVLTLSCLSHPGPDIVEHRRTILAVPFQIPDTLNPWLLFYAYPSPFELL